MLDCAQMPYESKVCLVSIWSRWYFANSVIHWNVSLRWSMPYSCHRRNQKPSLRFRLLTRQINAYSLPSNATGHSSHQSSPLQTAQGTGRQHRQTRNAVSADHQRGIMGSRFVLWNEEFLHNPSTDNILRWDVMEGDNYLSLPIVYILSVSFGGLFVWGLVFL